MELTSSNKPAPRFPLYLDIEYRKNYGRQAESGKLKNISLTGAFLETRDADLRADDKIVLTFVVSGRERKINAHIVWNNDHGCGIKFVPTNNRDVQIVDDLIYFVESKRKSRRSVLGSIFKKVS